jgi:serine protease
MLKKTLSLLLSSLLLASIASAQSSLAPLLAKPAKTEVHPEHHSTLVVVKFRHDSGIRLRDGLLVDLSPQLTDSAADLVAVRGILSATGGVVSPYFQQSEAELDAWRHSGEIRGNQVLHDLNLFFAVDLPKKSLVGATCDALNAYELVEIAYPASKISDPVVVPNVVQMLSNFLTSLFTPAPDYENQQRYRLASPAGVDADFGQYFSGSRGEGTLIADVETGWTDDHEDIMHKSLGNFVGLGPAPYPWDHGTAVLGELVGEDNANGVKGIVHQADVVMSSHLGSAGNIGTAIIHAANAAGPGDVVVLEVQCYSGAPSPHPCEYDSAIFATVQTATANGTHVFAAAGNGSNNLDGSSYGGLFDRNVRDSGAVMCGASDGESLNIAYFSNYGTRLDVHGWGFNVVTTGYGDLYNGGGVTKEYTAAFSGTSSATPIVTGAGIMINGIHREAFGAGLSPLNLRALMTATGTPQGSGGQIGPRPNVRTAIDFLGVPQITLSGNNVPGGTLIVDIAGSPGDNYTLGFSNSLLATPTHIAPYGYRYLGGLSQQASGVIPVSGTETLSFPIPNNGSLSGKTVGYVQAAVTFSAGPGTGSFTNYQPVEIL